MLVIEKSILRCSAKVYCPLKNSSLQSVWSDRKNRALEVEDKSEIEF